MTTGHSDNRVQAAVIDAYYASAVTVGGSARARAQSAQAITAALGAVSLAIVAATNTGQLLVVRGCATLATVCWFGASFLYLRAVSSRIDVTQALNGATTADQFVHAVLSRGRDEQKQVDARQRRANSAAAVASVLSLVALGASILVPAQDQPATWAPSAQERVRLESICGRNVTVPEVVSGFVVGSMDGSYSYTFRLEPDLCLGTPISVPGSETVSAEIVLMGK